MRLHAGKKTQTWNRTGEIPERMEEFGEDVWSPLGVKILGTPVGSLEFVESVTEERLEKEQELWRAIPSVPDLQCAWQLLLQCAWPRCHHFLRTVPPTQSRVYAEGHDKGDAGSHGEAWRSSRGIATAGSCTRRGHTAHAVGRIGSPFRVKNCAWCILGVVGRRIAHDANPSVPTRANVVIEAFEGNAQGCVGELQESTRVLDASGFSGRPSWTSFAGRRTPSSSLLESQSRANGSMAGNTTRLPLLNTTSGRP